jgi:hypothetical protein
VLAAHPDRLVVLMASVTWCRPCKGFQENYEAGAAAPLACVPLLVALVLDVPSAAHFWPWVIVGVGPHGRVGQKVGAAAGGLSAFTGTHLSPPPSAAHAEQKAARHYNDAIFLKFYGALAWCWVLLAASQPHACGRAPLARQGGCPELA